MTQQNQLSSLVQTLEASGIPFLGLILVALLLLLVIIALSFGIGCLLTRLSLSRSADERVKDALKRSRAVLGGLASEQLAPFLPNFPCNSADARFVGKPIDFIAFPGAATDGPIEEILLIEVKTGKSQLSGREKEIRDCVESGRVRYIEYRI